MIEELQFITNEFWWVAVGIAFLLVLLFVWKEWKGSFDSRFITNSLVGVVGILALLCLYLRPAMSTEVSGKAVVLTDNYKGEQLDSIRAKEKSIQAIRYKPGLDFSRLLDSINEVIVLGNGLPSFDFWQLEEVSTTYIKGAVPKGVVKLKYEPRLLIGNELNVSGLYNEPVPGNRLVLEAGSGDGLDSIIFNDAKEQVFTLRSKLKARGKFVYQLTEKDSTGVVLSSNPLPLEILEKEQLRIFISNGFPSFETKYLKNFLAEEGHHLVVRSQITKGRYKFEYFNAERSPLYGFRESDIKDFDLVILDADTYLSLSISNKNVLTGLMKDIGVGLFVQPNERLFGSANSMSGFEVERVVGQKNLKIKDAQVETHPYRFIGKSLNGIPVENHSYVMVNGKGRISTTLLKNTFQLVLDGKIDDYLRIYTSIISATAKAKQTRGTFETKGSFFFENEPIPFVLRTSENKPSAMVNKEYTVPLIKNTVLEDVWQGKTYSSNQGWHTLRLEKDTTVVMPYFVMDTMYWKSLRGIKTMKDNSRFFRTNAGKRIKKTANSQVNGWWFFMIFLSCMGYLWLAPKLKA